MTPLTDAQERVIEERAGLIDRCAALQKEVLAHAEDRNKYSEREYMLMLEQLGTMRNLVTILDARIQGFQQSVKYVCHKEVWARPMTRGEYNSLRGWTMPANENPKDEGFLVEDLKSPANHSPFAGHITWTPKLAFLTSHTKAIT